MIKIKIATPVEDSFSPEALPHDVQDQILRDLQEKIACGLSGFECRVHRKVPSVTIALKNGIPFELTIASCCEDAENAATWRLEAVLD